ncbi:MAG: hypothetical protein K8R74_11325 [Bacteroidales bacterium]|nr:hypothetical protein [Bacteroidales bacterium]
MKKDILVNDTVFHLSLNEPVHRYEHNPILNTHDVNKVWTDPGQRVVTVHNAGITVFNEDVLMLFRSHLRNGISVIGIAKSKNGINDWIVSEQPVLVPCNENDVFVPRSNIKELIENEAGGVEDPRISKIGETYFITYSAYHGFLKDRVRVSLATTKDFQTFSRHGPVLDKDMRNVVLFPEKIKEQYFALMRPNDKPGKSHTGGTFKEIRLATTNDPFSNNWKVSKDPVMKQEGGPSAFGDKIGPGAPPVKTKHGWLNVFHGVRSTMDGNPYVLGVALHDTDDPSKVKVSNIPILFPSRTDCAVEPGDYIHVPNVVFTCGALRNEDGTIFIYYGGNDTVMNVAFSHEDILAELCNRYPQDPLTGIPMYNFFK